ncbi:MAG: radical SAM protein [Oligoflexia bacterium]|nr:radical SAM protein [Oligoflexia bacterium]
MLLPKSNTAFEYLTLFVTNRCNLSCEHCFYHDSLNDKNHTELTADEISAISKSLPNFYHLALTGGEPFLRKDLSEIALTFIKNNSIHKLSIQTNGSYPQKIREQLTKLLEKNKSTEVTVFVSIDGFEKTHDEIRLQKGSFQKALESIEVIKDLQRRFSLLSFSIVATFQYKNQNEYFDFYNFLRNEIKPNSINLPYIRAESPKEATAAQNLNLPLYMKTLELNHKDIETGYLSRLATNLSGTFYHVNKMKSERVLVNTLQTNSFQTECFAGRVNAVVYPNGDLFPCEILDKKIGNLRDVNYQFLKLWKSPVNKQITSNIVKNKCFCTHRTFIISNVIFNKKNFLSSIWQTLKIHKAH